jgi:PBP1b-binding outer membrane lipoprotein LpoB
MGKAFKFLFVLVILACFFTYGCGSKDNPVGSYRNTNVQPLANVNFVLLTKNSSINPSFKLADLKMSSQASPQAIFSIRIIDVETKKSLWSEKLFPL